MALYAFSSCIASFLYDYCWCLIHRSLACSAGGDLYEGLNSSVKKNSTDCAETMPCSTNVGDDTDLNTEVQTQV